MDNFFTAEDWNWVLHTVVYLITALLLYLVGKYIFQLRHRNINVADELTEKDNVAFSIVVVGYYIGLLTAIGGAIIGPSVDLTTDVLNIVVFGIGAMILLNIASLINEKIILKRFHIYNEIINDENLGTAYIEAANYIASGLIIFGAVSGEIHSIFPGMAFGYQLSGIISMIIFWLIGQVLLVLAIFLYNALLPYDIHDQIEKRNNAVGIGYAAILIAFANLMRFGISDDFMGWSDHFWNIFFDVTLGLILLPFARWFTDWVLLPGENLTDEIVNQEKPNKGAALIEAFAYIGSSVLITWCL